MDKDSTFLVIDVESVGLHGTAFAVAGMLLNWEGVGWTFTYACHPDKASGADSDRKWVMENVPKLDYNCDNPREVRDLFWDMWIDTKKKYQNVIMAAECSWPVEARFLNSCIDDDKELRNWLGPYPLHDISSIMLAVGMDPMNNYRRLKDEKPEHHPLSDVKLSARLLREAFDG